MEVGTQRMIFRSPPIAVKTPRLSVRVPPFRIFSPRYLVKTARLSFNIPRMPVGNPRLSDKHPRTADNIPRQAGGGRSETSGGLRGLWIAAFAQAFFEMIRVASLMDQSEHIQNFGVDLVIEQVGEGLTAAAGITVRPHVVASFPADDRANGRLHTVVEIQTQARRNFRVTLGGDFQILFKQLGTIFKIIRRSAYALWVNGKPSWACVDLGGTSRWLASTSAALAEHGFPIT